MLIPERGDLFAWLNQDRIGESVFESQNIIFVLKKINALNNSLSH